MPIISQIPYLNPGQTFSAPGVTLTSIGYPTGSPASAAGISPGNLRPATPTGGAGASGGVPQVPDPAKSQLEAILANLGNWGQISNLGNLVNQWSNQQARAALEQNLPGYGANLAQQAANVSNLLAGKISPETIANIGTAAAERGVNVGATSPNANAALLRALGLTTEGLQTSGAQQFAQMIAQTPIGKQFDFNQFLNIPSEQQQWQYLANVLAASPDPNARNFLNQLMMLQGQGRIGGGGFTGYANAGNVFTNPTIQRMLGGSGTQTAQEIINTYMPRTGGGGGGGGAPAAAPGGGWGYFYDPSTGTMTSSGNVPPAAMPSPQVSLPSVKPVYEGGQLFGYEHPGGGFQYAFGTGPFNNLTPLSGGSTGEMYGPPAPVGEPTYTGGFQDIPALSDIGPYSPLGNLSYEDLIGEGGRAGETAFGVTPGDIFDFYNQLPAPSWSAFSP